MNDTTPTAPGRTNPGQGPTPSVPPEAPRTGKARKWRDALYRQRILWGLGVAALLITWWFVPPVWRLRKGPITITRWPKSGEMVLDVGPGTKTWVPIARVSRHVLHAFIAAEDGKFYQHNGFDFEAIARAYEDNAKHKKILRGASTISQQVVKMAFLSNDRNYVRKAREAVGTVLIERLLTKDQILEWYINMAEFGDGVFGIKAAAKHYFQTKPELLTIQQGAHLALVLPSPNKWSKGLRARKLTPFGQKRYARIINNMYFAGFITNVLRMTALATGDFGRPVQAFSEIKKKMNKDEPMNFNRDPDEEELELERKEEEDGDGAGAGKGNGPTGALSPAGEGGEAKPAGADGADPAPATDGAAPAANDAPGSAAGSAPTTPEAHPGESASTPAAPATEEASPPSGPTAAPNESGAPVKDDAKTP